jgi:chorismate-pyruvate lyase
VIQSEDLVKKILDAPVGQVGVVLGESLNCLVDLKVIEQNAVASHQFVRKITIDANGLPVIKALVKFDSSVLPEVILDELLKKKRGVGTILNINKIKATRNIISLNHSSDGNIISREYEIIIKGIVWFKILEEIHVNNLKFQQ